MATLQVQPVTEADLPALTRIFYAGFTTAIDRQMFPDTPGLRAWWADANRHDLLHKPGVRFLAVVDPTLAHSDDDDKLISYVKWDLDPENRGRRFPEWHPDTDGELCDQFFGGCDAVRREVMRGRGHYYLDMLVTHPEHQRRGAATMLVRWGCELADRTGTPVYIDATRAGVPVYERLGFAVVRQDAEAELFHMVREAGGKESVTGNSPPLH
ncbi:GNAT family N-acetyltransferase [Aspergillus homomorphus CBS 101889]|uniref:Acyl-CoA N-acyltransferase n=1 Tax=Aspergillus homomorphus (strain CBS 101889) TaxID=1450537 RepID=A0A395I0T6_ASPHC|nr:acyl-CoA N-acyltransferase [Aspergillus homomorphus CBS 101889]RAL13812.1 acyl-CoA N-acyltransferase [Aspergillus homomorphus CBS 101889]